MKQLSATADVDTTVAMLQPGRDQQIIRKHDRFVRATVPVSILQNKNFVVGRLTGLELRMNRAACHPQAALGVESHLDRLNQAVVFGTEELRFKTASQLARRQF